MELGRESGKRINAGNSGYWMGTTVLQGEGLYTEGVIRVWASTSTQAEFLELLYGLKSAVDRTTEIQVLTDSTTIVDSLTRNVSAPVIVHSILNDILAILDSFWFCSVKKVSRSLVSRTHQLA